MRYHITQRPLRIWKPADITDATGAVAFRWSLAEGEANTYAITDPAGQRVAALIQDSWRVKTRYTIVRPGTHDALATQRFAPLHPRLDVAVPDGGTLTLTGKPLSQQYTVTRNDAVIARVSGHVKRNTMTRGGGAYTVDIGDGEDVPLILACVLAAELMRMPR